jgi:uncharacterized membrane protein YfcA
VVVELAAGGLSGFFGIGGGFLIVPGLILATAMPIVNAIGSSLVAVTAFGVTTAANYAASGTVDWLLTALLLGGGILGGCVGSHLGRVLDRQKRYLNTTFAALIFAVSIFMLVRSFNIIRSVIAGRRVDLDQRLPPASDGYC